MNHTQSSNSAWPNLEQELLLKAALLQGDPALSAWHTWIMQVDPLHLDRGSQRLLALLYRNLKKLGLDEPLPVQLKRFYYQTWSNNQILFNKMGQLLTLFQAAGIQTMVVKGAALTVSYYQDMGARPMGDFDIVVPIKQAHNAIKLLTDQGWTPIQRNIDSFTEGYLACWHADAFQKDGIELDLHWHLLEECCYPGADHTFWAGAVPLKIGGCSTLTLNPTDQLLHACVHGVRWAEVPPLRWITDAWVILNSEYEIDWQRLLEQAYERRLILQMRETLGYLHRLLDAPIPSAILEQLHSEPVSQMELTEYRLNIQARGSLLGYFPQFWFRYSRHARAMPYPRKLFGFGRFLQHFLALDHLWHLPLYVIYAIIRNIIRWSQRFISQSEIRN